MKHDTKVHQRIIFSWPHYLLAGLLFSPFTSSFFNMHPSSHQAFHSTCARKLGKPVYLWSKQAVTPFTKHTMLLSYTWIKQASCLLHELQSKQIVCLNQGYLCIIHETALLFSLLFLKKSLLFIHNLGNSSIPNTKEQSHCSLFETAQMKQGICLLYETEILPLKWCN